MALILFFVVFVPLCPHFSSAQGETYDQGDGEGRVCFGCLDGHPTFNVRNQQIKKGSTFPPCFFHQQDTCAMIASDYKCFIQVNIGNPKNTQVVKGCMQTMQADGCYPPNSNSDSNKAQTCYCSKRLCNSDLLLMGGNPQLIEELGLHEIPASGASGIMNQLWLLIVGLVLLALIHSSDQLMCCTGRLELKIVEATDNDQVVGTPCTNRGTNCRNVRCGVNTCTEDWDKPDTNCTMPVTCDASMKKPICRLLYYQVAEDENTEEDQGVALTFTYFAQQDCFDNSEDDVKIGCQFNPKIFYKKDDPMTEKITRTIYQKECFCDTNICNSDLFEVCVLTNSDLHHVNDTCADARKHESSTAVLTIPLTLALCIYFTI